MLMMAGLIFIFLPYKTLSSLIQKGVWCLMLYNIKTVLPIKITLTAKISLLATLPYRLSLLMSPWNPDEKVYHSYSSVAGAIPALPLDKIGNYFTSGNGWFIGSVFAGLISANVANLLMTYKIHTSKSGWFCMNGFPILTVALVAGSWEARLIGWFRLQSQIMRLHRRFLFCRISYNYGISEITFGYSIYLMRIPEGNFGDFPFITTHLISS